MNRQDDRDQQVRRVRNGLIAVLVGGAVWFSYTVRFSMQTSSRGLIGEIAWKLALMALAVPFVALIAALVVQRHRRRLAALRQRFPEALVMSMNRPRQLDAGLRELGFEGQKLPERFVFVVTDGQIQLWIGAGEPEMRFAYPTADVVRVFPTLGTVSRPVHCIGIEVAKEEGTVVLPFSPSLEGWRLPFSRLNVFDVERDVQRVSEAIADA